MAPFIIASSTYHSYQGWFGDIRLDHCVNKFKRSMEEHLSVNVKQISASRAEQKSFYRALCNEKVSEGKMIESLSSHCGGLVCGREVIVISDSSEINLNKHTGRLKTGEGSGVGVVGNNSDAGFFIHPGLVIDSMQGHVLGYSSLQIWTREPGHADKKARNYGRLPIMAQDNPHSQPIEEVYSPEEIEFMHVLTPTLEGKTELLKNKHNPQKLAWTAWIMEDWQDGEDSPLKGNLALFH